MVNKTRNRYNFLSAFRPTGNALRVLARPVRLAFDSVASSFTVFLLLPFLPFLSRLSLFPREIHHDALQQSRPLVFHATTIYLPSAVRNGDRKWWRWRSNLIDFCLPIFYLPIFSDSSLITFRLSFSFFF